MIKPTFKLLISILGILLLKSTYAAQLIDQIPTTLEGNWSICIYFESSKADCKIQEQLATTIDSPKQINHIIYQKDFIINSELKKSNLGLWLGVIDGVDEVRLNGILIGRTGRFPPQFQSAFRYERLYGLPSFAVKYNQFNHLEIKTFSSINRTAFTQSPIKIGEYFQLFSKKWQLNVLYIITISICLLLSIFLIFHYFMVKNSKESIYLALFLMAYSIIAFARSELPLQMGLDLSAFFKIELFMLSTATIAFLFFVLHFFDLEIRKLYTYGIFLIVLPGLISITFPDPSSLRIIAEYGYLLICLAVFFTTGSALMVGFLKKRSFSKLIGSISVFGWLVMFSDAVSQAKSIFHSSFSLPPFWLPFSFAIISIYISLIIFYKYWLVFKGDTFDSLTNTLLRPAFFQRLSEEFHRSQSNNFLLMVAIIHIQEIKTVNVSYGHNIGNKIIVTISSIISRLIKPYDLNCRFSDNEFCIAIAVKSRAEGVKTLQHLNQQFSIGHSILEDNNELFINTQIGGVIYNSDQHLSVSQLIQDANYGLAKAKSKKNKDYWLMDNPIVNQ